MKSPRPKIHLLDVDDPLLAYHQLVMRCGVTLRNAVPKFMAAEDMPIPLPVGTCLRCLKNFPEAVDQRKYCYGLVEAQEEKDSAGESLRLGDGE